MLNVTTLDPYIVFVEGLPLYFYKFQDISMIWCSEIYVYKFL